MEFEIRPIKRELIIDGFNNIYYFEFGKDFSHPPEKHDFWEMVYVDSGEIIAITDGLGRTLKQGQAIFHRPNELHAHVSDNKVPNNMLVVSFTTKSSSMEFFDKKVFTLNKTGKMLLSLFILEAKNALGEIPGDYANKNALDFSSAKRGSFQLLECYITEFLIVLLRTEDEMSSRVERCASSRELAQSSTAELIMSYIRDNIYNNLTITDICNKFFIGKSRLYKLFDEYVGEGPIEYYLRLKMTEAKRLLLHDEILVTGISDKLGYSSIHNFSRAFKKAFGISPVEYRKKINRVI